MLRSGVALALVTLTLAACDVGASAEQASTAPTRLVSPATPVPETSTPAASSTLRYAVAEPAAIVPHDAVTPEERLVVDTLFDSLTTLTPSLRPAPAAAVTWDADETATTWTFRLREGATFHDGTPVTSSDFAFAWSLAAASGRASYLLQDVAGYEEVAAGQAESLAGVRAVDPSTLEVRLSAPHGSFPTIAAHPALGPVPAGVWRDDEAAYRARPIGNGPFLAAEARVPRQFLRLESFDDWRNGEQPADLDEVLFQFLDPDTAYLAFQQDRLQVGPLPLEAIDQAIREYGISTDGYAGPGVLLGETADLYFIGFNTRRPPFNEPDVRRAVSLAIDRGAMVEAVVGASAVPAASVTSPLIRLHDEETCTACDRNILRARALFAEHDVSELEFWFNEDGGHAGVAEQLQDDLQEAGVRVRFATSSFEEYLADLETGRAAFFRFGWAPEHPLPGDVLFPLFHSSQVAGGRNYSRYSDPDVDRWLEQGRAATSLLGRATNHILAERRIVGQDQAVVPLFFYGHHHVVSERVEGFVLDPLGLANLEEVTLRDG